MAAVVIVSSSISVGRSGDSAILATLGLFVALLLLFPLPSPREVRAGPAASPAPPAEAARGAGRESETVSPKDAAAKDVAPAAAGESLLRVRVRGPGGEPVPGANVIEFGADPGTPALIARASGDGNFELRLARGMPGVVAAVASGWGSAEPLDVRPEVAYPPPVELRLRPFAVLRGTLRDGQGRPLAGVGFELREEVAGEDPASARARARRYAEVPAGGHTESDGSFAVAGLVRGAQYRMELLPGPWNSRPCQAFSGLEPRDEPVELVCDPSGESKAR